MLNAACFNRLKYAKYQAKTTIGDAIAFTRELSYQMVEEKIIQSGDLLDTAAINEVAETFNNTQKSSGMMGVEVAVKDCYAATTIRATLDNMKALERCVVLDIVADRVDSAFSAEMSKDTHKVFPPTAFWEQKVWLDRVNGALLRLHSVSAAITTEKVSAYADQAMKKLVEILEVNRSHD